MSTRRRALLATLWLLSLVAASRWGGSEAREQRAGAQIVTGADLGFMVFPGTSETGHPVGSIVVRQTDGRWVAAEIAAPVFPDGRGRIVPLR